MAEITLNKKLYIEINSNYYDEKDFQGVVRKNLLSGANINLCKTNELFCYFMDYKISSPYGNSKPDLIIFDNEYTHYWVLEVELSTHSWNSHIEPQLTRLIEGNYSRVPKKILQNIKNTNQENNINDKKFINLIKYTEPKFLLVTDKTPRWKNAALKSSLKFDYIELKTFLSRSNESVYMTDGLALSLVEDSILAPHDYYYSINNNNLYAQYETGEYLTAILDGQDVKLNISKTKNDLFLFPQPRNVMKKGKYYYIRKISQSSAILKEKK